MQVSVVIPCHNAGAWIAETLRSVAAQIFPPREIIVIDDASTDDSIEQIQHCGVEVRLLRTQFRNAAAARNAGIEATTGDWIALLDADDIWYPHHLADAKEMLSGGGDDVAYMANFDVEKLDGQVETLPTRHPIKESRSALNHREMIPFMTGNCLYGHSTVLYRRSRLTEIGGFDPSQKRRHDIDLWLRVLQDRTWAYQSRPAAIYRTETPGSISRHLSECEFFFLRALLRFEPGYRGQEWDQLIATSARRGMSLSFVDGEPTLYKMVRTQSWPYLSGRLRFAYQAAGIAPIVLRSAIQLKRAIRNRWLGGVINAS
jgi:glycosyltransferase involved in cell wall biosynthesis